MPWGETRVRKSRRGSGTRSFSVEFIDLRKEIIISLTSRTGDAVLDEFDDGRGFVQGLNVAGANNEATTSGEKADDGVVTLVTEDVAELAASARRLGMGVGHLEEGDLTGMDPGPAGVVEAFAIEVGAGGTVDCLGVGEEVKEGDGIANKTFHHFLVDRVMKFEDGSVHVFFDGTHLAFGEAFVRVWGRELNAE